MASGGKLLKTAFDPLGSVVENNVSKGNAIRQVVDPTGIARQNYKETGNLTIQNATDPGNVFTKSQEQKDTIAAADAYELGAPDRAANSATDAANQALLQRKKRLQSGLGSLSTGAQGGTAQLSTANAYGKSSLGA